MYILLDNKRNTISDMHGVVRFKVLDWTLFEQELQIQAKYIFFYDLGSLLQVDHLTLALFSIGYDSRVRNRQGNFQNDTGCSVPTPEM